MKDLDDYLRAATKSIFRFEYLQDFSATDKEGMARWESNGLDIEQIGKGWWEELDELHKKGVVTQRVRRIVYPINGYTKFEIEIHKFSTKHGDSIRIIDDKIFQTLNLDFQDFWLIDDSIALPMQYADKGLYEGFSIDEKIDKYVSAKNVLWEKSTPLSI